MGGDREGPDGADPFDGLRLDEDFVGAARYQEGSADERVARLQRIDGEHRRLQAEREAARAAAGSRIDDARRSRRWWRRLVRSRALVIVFVLVAVLIGWQRYTEQRSASRAAQAPAPRSTPRPPPSAESQPDPLGVPAPLPDQDGPFTFTSLQPNGQDPVTYDPCRPIHVVVNSRTAPVGGTDLLNSALDIVSEASGLQFVVDGATTETPSVDREPYQPERYPGRWAPVLVAWSDPDEDPNVADEVLGAAGSDSTAGDGSTWTYVTGTAALDGPAIQRLLDGPDGFVMARATVVHELAHIVGLGHVDQRDHLMHPELTRQATTLGPGDRRGLAVLGQGPCRPDL